MRKLTAALLLALTTPCGVGVATAHAADAIIVDAPVKSDFLAAAGSATPPLPALDVGSLEDTFTDVDYGDNANGWQVVIRNESDETFPIFVETPFSNIASHSGNLGAHNTSHIQGMKSWFGGPARIDFRYQDSKDALNHDDQLICYIGSDPTAPLECLTTSPRVTVEISRNSPNKPLEAVLRNR